MNACAVSDHVIAHGLRPCPPTLPEQLIFVRRTDEKMGPIRGPGMNQSEGWKRLNSDESQRWKPPRRVVERRYIM